MKWLDTAKAGRLLGVSRRSVARWCNHPKAPLKHKVWGDNRRRCISVDDLYAWLKENQYHICLAYSDETHQKMQDFLDGHRKVRAERDLQLEKEHKRETTNYRNQWTSAGG